MMLIDDDELHPYERSNPEQFATILGGSSENTQGSPPFLMRRMTIEEFEDYVESYDFGPIKPDRLVLHHTWKPTLESWNGLSTLQGIQRYYAGLGWTSGPHIFSAPDGIWLATPMSMVGIHAGIGNGSVKQGWYSIGWEMVGDYDKVRPSGPVWEQTLRGIIALIPALNANYKKFVTFHRDYTNTKSCPGNAVQKEWVSAELQRAVLGHQTTDDLINEGSSILTGPPITTHESFVRYVNAQGSIYTPYDVDSISTSITYWSNAAGINPDVVRAMALHEASEQIDEDPGYEALSSWWAQRPRRNGWGYGVTGRTAKAPPAKSVVTIDGQKYFTWAQRGDTWAEGISFPTWDLAVQAVVGRLVLYVYGKNTYTDTQKKLATFTRQLRPLNQKAWGTVTMLKHLGAAHNPANYQLPREKWVAGWAWPGTLYGQKLAELIRKVAKI